MSVHRCGWCLKDDLYISYHDTEWGLPVHDERTLFEFLILETMQAGLSWHTVLKKREAFRAAYHNFDVQAVARFTEADVERLLSNAGIIRNRAKITASIVNAQAFLRVAEEWGTFDRYIWNFVDGAPVVNAWTELSQLPATTPLSDLISRDLRRRGFSFVGSTVVYAHMQATGMVNDHLTSCFRYHAVMS